MSRSWRRRGSRTGRRTPCWWGGPGVGKTRLAVAIGVEAAKAGREVRFAGCARLVEGLEDASPRGMPKDRLRHHAHSRPLVIDELGRLGMDGQGADPMSRPVSTRCERRPATITANVGIGGWAKVLGDEATAGAIADGACHRCTPTKITGRPHRLEGLPADKRREGQSKTAKVR